MKMVARLFVREKFFGHTNSAVNTDGHRPSCPVLTANEFRVFSSSAVDWKHDSSFARTARITASARICCTHSGGVRIPREDPARIPATTSMSTDFAWTILQRSEPKASLLFLFEAAEPKIDQTINIQTCPRRMPPPHSQYNRAVYVCQSISSSIILGRILIHLLTLMRPYAMLYTVKQN